MRTAARTESATPVAAVYISLQLYLYVAALGHVVRVLQTTHFGLGFVGEVDFLVEDLPIRTRIPRHG